MGGMEPNYVGIIFNFHDYALSEPPLAFCGLVDWIERYLWPSDSASRPSCSDMRAAPADNTWWAD